MRIAPRRLPELVAALVLCAAVGSFPGCTAHGPRIDLTQRQPVIIVVAFDQNAGKISSVTPEPVPLWEQYQYPVWYLIGAPDGSKIQPKFKKDDPLEPGEPAGATAAAKKEAARCETPTFRMGVPKKGTAGKTFEYAITVTLPDGTTTTLDPRMQIWP